MYSSRYSNSGGSRSVMPCSDRPLGFYQVGLRVSFPWLTNEQAQTQVRTTAGLALQDGYAREIMHVRGPLRGLHTHGDGCSRLEVVRPLKER